MNAVYSFLRVLNDPKEIENIEDEEVLEIAKNINFNIVKHLNESRHSKILRENDEELIKEVIKKANSKDNIEMLLDSLKIQCLMGKELYMLIKNIMDSIDNKESVVKFLIQILHEVDESHLRDFLSLIKDKNENTLLKELIKMAELILDTKTIKNKFSRNLNTIIEECKVHD
jgi:DNA-binding phage protein